MASTILRKKSSPCRGHSAASETSSIISDQINSARAPSASSSAMRSERPISLILVEQRRERNRHLAALVERRLDEDECDLLLELEPQFVEHLSVPDAVAIPALAGVASGLRRQGQRSGDQGHCPARLTALEAIGLHVPQCPD